MATIPSKQNIYKMYDILGIAFDVEPIVCMKYKHSIHTLLQPTVFFSIFNCNTAQIYEHKQSICLQTTSRLTMRLQIFIVIEILETLEILF
jgi:uncharacterized membrane protein